MSNDKHTFTLRLEPQTFAALKQTAAKNLRSVQQEIHAALRRHLAAEATGKTK